MSPVPSFSDLPVELDELCFAIWKRGEDCSNLDLSLELEWPVNLVSQRLSELVGLGRLKRRNRVGSGGHAQNRELILLDARGEVVPALGRSERDAPKQRRCLGGCGKRFLSTWAGHRVCDACRERQGRVSPFAPEVGR